MSIAPQASAHLFWLVVSGLVTAQLVLRGWALAGGWFYGDDYLLLQHAVESPGWASLLEPHNGHLMPAGRALVVAVLWSGELNWPLVVALSLVLQLVGSAACVWMLTTLFGRTWRVVPLLAIYLFGAITLPAFMWWAASLNQLAMQPAFFLATACWIRHLRGEGHGQAACAVAAVAFGLAFDVKALLIVPVLLYLALAYFGSGAPHRRLLALLRRFPWTVASVALGVGTYAGYYLTQVEQPFGQEPAPGLLAELTGTMVGTAFATATVGGPWRWDSESLPNAGAAPGVVLLVVTWVVLAFALVGATLRRRRTLRAWLLLSAYLAVLVGLLYSSRVSAFGTELGLQYRFLTDAACVLVLCVGLACLPLLGAVESSAPRERPVLLVGLRPASLALVTAWLVASGSVSSVAYARVWHDQDPGAEYVRTLVSDLRTTGAVDLADTAVPDHVVPALAPPYNQLSKLLRLVREDAAFPEVTDQLAVVDGAGSIRPALVDPVIVSETSPGDRCGWQVDEGGLTIPLQSGAIDFPWWVRVGYLSSSDSPVVVTAGPKRVTTEVSRGLNSIYVRVVGSFDRVRIDGLTSGTTLCIDVVEVGNPVAASRT